MRQRRARVAAGVVFGAIASVIAGTGAAVALPSARGAPAERQQRTVWDGLYTSEQADRGAALYREWCASCHAPDLSGGDVAPGLVGGEFVWNWSGLTVGQLFERLRISMPQEDPSRVTRAEKADILAFMLRANAFPAGAHELPDRAAMLDQFLFEALEPAP